MKTLTLNIHPYEDTQSEVPSSASCAKFISSTPFADLIPLLPPDYRPLLCALVDENNHLLGRVRQRARQNHVLLRRSVELMQELLHTLFPSRQTSLYNGNGHKRGQLVAARPLYNAVG